MSTEAASGPDCITDGLDAGLIIKQETGKYVVDAVEQQLGLSKAWSIVELVCNLWRNIDISTLVQPIFFITATVNLNPTTNKENRRLILLSRLCLWDLIHECFSFRVFLKLDNESAHYVSLTSLLLKHNRAFSNILAGSSAYPVHGDISKH